MTKNELEAKFDKFLADYNNKYIKVLPNNFSPQCFDQVVKWTDILSVPHFPNNPSPFPYPNAFQIYTDFGAFQDKYFTRVSNTPDYVPQKGDIVVWAGSFNGGIGHVATATGTGNVSTFQAFSQNVPLGSNSHLVTFSYNHVLGALRLKVTSSPQPPISGNLMEKNAKENIDKILNFFKEKKFIDNDASETWLNVPNDQYKLLGLVKRIVRDLEAASQDTWPAKKAKVKGYIDSL